MPRKGHEADSDTTVVNIADFQRTRDSVCFFPSIPIPIHPFIHAAVPTRRVVAHKTRPINKAYSSSLTTPSMPERHHIFTT